MTNPQVKPPPTWHLLWHLMRYAPRLFVADGVLWIVFASFFPAIPGLIIREFFDTLTGTARLQVSAWIWVILLLAVGVGRIIALVVGQYVRNHYRFTISALLRRNFLAYLLQRPGAKPLAPSPAENVSASPGEVLSYLRDDIKQIENNVVKIADFVGDGLFSLVFVVILLNIHARITLLVFLPLVGVVLVLQRLRSHIKRYWQASRQATQAVTGLLGEIFSAIQAIQIAAAEPEVMAHFRQVNAHRRRLMIKDRVFTALLDSAFENVVSLGTGLILLVVALTQQSGSAPLSVGDFALFVYALSFVTGFLSFLGRYLALCKRTEVSFERMAGLLQGASAQTWVAHHPLHLQTLWMRKPPLPTVAQPVRDQHLALRELRACNLTYLYPGSDRGIREVSLTIPQGSLVAITGPVGAGKTTLLHALLGLLPLQAGEIYWNGQRVKHPADFFVPPRCAYTPQVPQLFSSSLRDNILLGLEASPTALETAIQLAVFEQDLAAMPQGLATPIGPKGVRLSGGQIQRAAAARMFVRHPDLLVFDDLSSALDVETEQRLWQGLLGSERVREWGSEGVRESPLSPASRLRQHPITPSPQHPVTLLIVSHRPAVLERSDRIIVLNHGRVEMEGSFDELPVGFIR